MKVASNTKNIRNCISKTSGIKVCIYHQWASFPRTMILGHPNIGPIIYVDITYIIAMYAAVLHNLRANLS